MTRLKLPTKYAGAAFSGKTQRQVDEAILLVAMKGAHRDLKALLDTDLTPEQRQLVVDVFMYVADIFSFVSATYSGKLTGNQHHAKKPLVKAAFLRIARGHQTRGLKGRRLARETYDDLVEVLGYEPCHEETVREWLRQLPGK